MNRPNTIIAGVGIATLLLLFLFPPIGFVAAIVMLVIAPPWGRSLAERGLISALIFLGLASAVLASEQVMTSNIALMMLALLVVIGVALRFTPYFSSVRIPRLRVSDGLLVALAIGSWLWLIGPFMTRGTALTSEVTEAVAWNATTFALCLTALAWMAGDLAERFAKMRDVSMSGTGIVAVLGFGAFALFGSPTFMFNAGLTNVLMATTVMVVSGYLSARSWQSARKLGWFLIPVAAVALSILWVPAYVGLLIPAGIVVVALWRVRWWLVLLWMTSVLAILVIFNWPMADQSVVEATQFNLGAALVMPFIALAVALTLIREGHVPLGLAILSAQLGLVVLLIGGVTPTLTAANAALIAGAPLVAALMAGVLVVAVRSVGRVMAVAGSITAVLLGAVIFGYVGPEIHDGLVPAAPGLEAHRERVAALATIIQGGDGSLWQVGLASLPIGE